MSSKYTIDFPKLVAELMPPHKRKPVRITFIYRLLTWIRGIHAQFTTLQQELEYQAKITSQVIVFESHLVDLFGEGITITVNEVAAQEAYLAADEDDDLGLLLVDDDQDEGGFYISDDDQDTSTYNFTVNVPAVLNADLDRMRAVINKYKVSGSTYQIIES